MKKLFSILMLMIIGLSGTAYAEDFQINKGWNLVSPYYIENLDFEKKDKIIYFFDILKKEYISYSNLIDYFQKENINSITSITGHFNKFDDPYLTLTPVWYYSNQEKTISRNSFNDNSVRKKVISNILESNLKVKLSKGWNLINYDVIFNNNQYSFEKIKGTCNIVKKLYFDSQSQTWKKFNSIFEDEKNNGNGLAIKVENDCEFDFSEKISAPPAIPEN
jgi:hypothetical protein